MFNVNKLKQVLVKGLIFLLVMTNFAVNLSSVQAAATDSVEGSSAAATFSEKISSKDHLFETNDSNNNATDSERELQFKNRLLNYYLMQSKKDGPEWLRTTDFQLNFTQNHKPIYSFETLQRIGAKSDSVPFWFWQGRYAHENSDSSTANLGVGWRKLSEDRTNMIGLNLFYDYSFHYELSRIGLGGEYFNKLTEYRFNTYHALSGEKEIGRNYLPNSILVSYIRAVDGMDFEVGTSFTHLPWLKVFAGGYYWDNKYNDDEKGYRLRSTLQLTPRLNMELGYTNSNVSHKWYGQIKYQLANGYAPSLWGEKRTTKAHRNDNDISDKLMQKVERENDIKTETYTKFTSYKGSIRTTVTNMNNAMPITGAKVQVYQNGTAIGDSATTNEDGIAVISDLAVGTYTVNVTYGTATGTSVATVTKNTTADTTVSLNATATQAEMATATVTVINQGNTGINIIYPSLLGGSAIVNSHDSISWKVQPNSDLVFEIFTARGPKGVYTKVGAKGVKIDVDNGYIESNPF